jgi:hypothetical protein
MRMKWRNGYLVAALVMGVAGPGWATGNGAPSGGHYNLNILGKDHCAGDDLTGSNRHTIQVLLDFNDGSQNGTLAVDLDRRNKIFLAEGDFQVLDGNACDSDGAKFQLPADPYTCPVDDPQCLNTDPSFQAYTIWARALAKPGGSATITTCATGAGADGVLGTADDEIVCSTENTVDVLTRRTGRSKFTNVTKELTTLCLDTDTTPGCDTRIGIFDDALQDYFWDYDNNGLRLAQLRFYPIID